MQFEVGQIVRLKRGNTPMQIIKIIDTPNRMSRIIAKYCHNYTVLITDFLNPTLATATYTRDADQFIHWHGDMPKYAMNMHLVGQIMMYIAYREANHQACLISELDFKKFMTGMTQGTQVICDAPTPKQYMLKRVRGAVTAVIGDHIATTRTGLYVLEMTDGEVITMHPDNLQPYERKSHRVIHVVSAKPRSAYACYYSVPLESDLKEDDLIMSDSGNIYRVVMSDVQRPVNIKAPFKGKKIVTEDL